MNVPPPAASAAPLTLYDYTHGQRRLMIWRQSDARGLVTVFATLSVPVTLQAPGEAPEIQWRTVAAAGDSRPMLVPLQNATADYRLELGTADFWLYRMEAQAVDAYLALNDMDGEESP